MLSDGSQQCAEVKIIQRWNGYRPKISLLLGSFYAYLVGQQIIKSHRQKELKKYPQNNYNTSYINSSSKILWIEKLLQTPIADYRKNAVSLIVAPYLVNIKKLAYDDALSIINNWLMECGKLKRLDQNFDYIVRYALKYSAKNGHKPLKLDTLKLKNELLYDILQ